MNLNQENSFISNYKSESKLSVDDNKNADNSEK